MLTVFAKGGGSSQGELGLDRECPANYYYAPAMSESAGPGHRESFQEVESGVQNGAREVAHYTYARGWDEVREAGNENEFRNAEQSRQLSQGVSGQGISAGQQPWQTGVAGGQPGQSRWTGTQAGEGQSGMGPSSLAQGAQWTGQSTWARPGGLSGQWTGTQYGEGQPGMGPSSLAQGAQWTGQSAFAGGTGLQQGTGGQRFAGQGFEQFGGNLPSWTYAPARETQAAFGQGVQGGFGGQTGWTGQRWTGTQYGEGQQGMGPSSLAQGAHWVGQSTFGGAGQPNLGGQGPFSGALPPWTHQAAGQEQPQGIGTQGARWPAQASAGGWGGQAFGGGIPGGTSGWTGTQYGEGRPGMGPSSLAQGASFTGQPSLQGGFAGQQGFGQQQWTGTQYGEGRPGTGPSSLAQGARWAGEPSWASQGGQLGNQGSQTE